MEYFPFTPELFAALLEDELRLFRVYVQVAGRRGDDPGWQVAVRVMLTARLNALAN